MGYVAVIDTGIDDCSLAYKNVKEQYVVRENETQLYVSEEPATDNIGHGTEIANLIVKQNPKAELIIIRAFEQTLTSVDALISALDFLIHHGNIDFVNLSCGITSITNIIGLRNVCDTLLKRNTVLVSAFDNNGALSFPAAFDSVIGVDVTSKKKLIHKFQKSYVVNYFEENKFYRVTGLNNKKGIIRGTSYACAETTGKLSCEYNTLEKRNELLQQIKKNKINRTFHTPAFKIKKSIIFPLNKESDCIIRQKDKLGFEIAGVFDEKRKCRIGKEINGLKIEDFLNIEWEQDFDTVIISCTEELEEITGIPYRDIISEKARIYSKQIYSFEKIDCFFQDMGKVFFPRTTVSESAWWNMGKMYKSSVPTVVVAGTNSKQGKFTLQTSLVDYFRKQDYETGFLATEPSGYLFDADYVFPMGYNSTVEFNNNPSLFIPAVNNIIQFIEEKNKEIIIAGSQSYSIQYDNSFLDQFSICQHLFFLGIDPDAYVLTVSLFDEIEYITRTVNYLNSLSNGKVISFVLSPFSVKETVTGITMRVTENDRNEVLEKKKELKEKFSVPVFEFSEIENLGSSIINFFGETNE